jgi:hypothetical protein
MSHLATDEGNLRGLAWWAKHDEICYGILDEVGGKLVAESESFNVAAV